MMKKIKRLPLTVLAALFCLIAQVHFASAGTCYKKYIKSGGRCLRKYRNGKKPLTYDYEKCCRLKDAAGWKPSGQRICIRCQDIVDGGWSQWSQWTKCPVKCDWGERTRGRKCNSPPPQHGGNDCKGTSLQKSKCYAGVRCPIHGKWGPWSKWSACSKSCKYGGGQSRIRKCDSPKPQFGGDDCLGASEDVRRCNQHKECPVNGNWGSWSSWSSCSVRCGSGTMTRSRRCDKPKPKFNGEHCKGKFADNLPCFRTCTGIIPTKSTFDSGSGSGSGSSEGSGSGDSGSGSGSEEGLDKEVESGGANKTVKNNETGAISEYGSGSGATNSGTSNKNTIISIKKQSLKAGSGEGSGEEEAGGLGDNESGDSKALTSSGNSAISSGKNIAKSDIVESLIETNVMDSNKSTDKRNEPGWGEKFEEIKL